MKIQSSVQEEVINVSKYKYSNRGVGECGEIKPRLWVKHSYNVAKAAKNIASQCDMNSEKAYVCGLLHDIGRRTGIAAVRHIIDGYDYAISQNWNEVARVCLTHSFPI